MRNRFFCFFVFLLLLAPVYSANKQVVHETNSLSITIEGDKITRLYNKLTNTLWSLDSVSLFGVDIPEVETDLKISTQTNGQIMLKLTLKNSSNEKIYPTPTFPILRGMCVKGKKSEDLHYLFPRQGYAPNNIEPVAYSELYSAYFPLQFMDVYDKAVGGFYVMTNDTTNYAKRYSLSKQSGKVDMQVAFKSKALAPDETWELPAIIIGAHKGDWHNAFFAYKNWVKTWYKPISSRKTWFQDIYNFRQVFIHTIFGELGVFNQTTKEIDLVSRIEADMNAFGKIDYVHIFDWMRTPQGRIIDYDPWDYLGGHQGLLNQIKLIQQKGLRVGLYFEGYIMSKYSKVGMANGEAWQQLDQYGQPYTKWGLGNYLPCAFVPEFQEYMRNLIHDTSTLLEVDGGYMDQYGFGYQYGCYNSLHDHDTHITDFKTNLQVLGEGIMAQAVKSKISPNQVLYVEESPTDVSTQYYDGSFSYAIQKGRYATSNNPAVINIARFALPDFKTFQILRTDRPLGDDQEGVKHIFFNGEGIWLAGPLNDSGWFPESVRKLIRKTHTILSNNKEAFRSADAVPLVSTLNTNVYSNYFPSARKNVWTFFNASDVQHSGAVIKVPHISGAIYYDGWNFKQIYPAVVDNMATINLQINGRDVGCLIQTLDPLNMVLPEDPVVVEKEPELSIFMNTNRKSGSNVSFQLSAGGTGSVYVDWEDGNLVEYGGDAISSSVNTPTVLSNTVTSNGTTIKVYTKDRYIIYLDCNSNDLGLLNVDNAPMLRYLRCYKNNLTELNLANNQELIVLQCYSNQLTRLDVSNSIKLTQLLCNANRISSLNITGLEILRTLSAMLNPLGSIDLSTNCSLETLNLRNASLISLDVSKNPLISSIEIFNIGPTNANNFSACALDSLYLSLPDKSGTTSGVLKVIYSQNTPLGNSVEGSNKDIAEGKNWTVSSSANEILSGDGGECEKTGLSNKLFEAILIHYNPTYDLIEVKMDKLSGFPTIVEIIDVMGRRISRELITSPSKTIDMSKYSKGIYVVRVNNITKKILKK